MIRTDALLPAVLDGLVEVAIRPPASFGRDGAQALATLFERWAMLADAGAFVAAGVDPGVSTFRVSAQRVLPEGGAWLCDARGVDWRAAQVLRNALVMFSAVHAPVDWLHMRVRDARDAIHAPGAIGAHPLASSYPPCASRLPFRVSRLPHGAPRDGRRVEIEFADALADDALAVALARLDAWGAVALGGYPRSDADAQSGDGAVFDASADIFDESTIELAIQYFGATEEAWHGLLNLCARTSADVAPVVEVRIA